MTHVVAEPCINCKFTDCVYSCPADCFHEGETMLAIDPEERYDGWMLWRSVDWEHAKLAKTQPTRGQS